MKKVAVLIPCYNEEKTVEKVVADYRRALPQADIYVYDNNSTDRTAELAQKAGAIVRREYRQGKGNVIRSMFRQIDADCYLMTDGDDTYPAENAPEMVRMVLEGEADMVNGDRLSSTYFTENKRPFHNTGNRVVRGLINRLFGAQVREHRRLERHGEKPEQEQHAAAAEQQAGCRLQLRGVISDLPGRLRPAQTDRFLHGAFPPQTV